MTIAEIIAWAQTIGAPAAPIFAFLFWIERGERIDAQNELKTIAKDSITAIVNIDNTIGNMDNTVNKWMALFRLPGKGQ